MNVLRSVAAVVLLGVVAAGATTDVRDQPAPEFSGTWTLVSWTAELPDGEVVHPFGEGAAGVLVYGESGRMSVQIMRADRPRFGAVDPMAGSAREKQAAYDGYLAYWGTYETQREEGTVIHVLQGSLFPDWVGTRQVREFEFEGDDRLTLRTPPIASAVTDGREAVHVLAWKRVG